MKVHRDFSGLDSIKNPVVTIGSFDGVHCGHRIILERLKKIAGRFRGESVVISFHPHPRLFLFPEDKQLRLLNTLEEKIHLLEKEGVDHLVLVPFDDSFASQTPEEYILHFLIGQFHPSCVVVGYDHKFGKGRKGDIHLLKEYGSKYQFEVVEIPRQEVEDIAVSSTKIRAALEHGDVRKACRLLGDPYELTGSVVRGQQIGKELGFPTANLEIPETKKLIPADGIYAVRILLKGFDYSGMLYIGTRPTLEQFTYRTIEVHIFDFDENIYNTEITVRFVEKIREDRRFDTLEALTRQLQKDRESALKILEQPTDKLFSTAIVILNYNGKVWFEKFLDPLIRYSPESARIVVADNFSTDGSIPFLKEHFPEVDLIRLDRNYGFAEGYNRAIDKISEPFVLLLNSDVAVSAGWLNPLVKKLDSNPQIGAVQPKIKSYGEPNKFEYAGAAGGWIDSLGYPFCRGRIFQEVEEDTGQYDQACEIFWATGAAFLIRTSLFKAIGGFDGSFFAHLEEIDLCWRLKRAGYQIVFEPSSEVYHVGGGTLGYSSPGKTYLNFRNSLFTLLKNKSIAALSWIIPTRLVLDGLAGLVFLKEGKWRHLLAIIRAHFSFYGGFRKSLQRRTLEAQAIKEVKIDDPNESGQMRGSIVWNYYVAGKRKFSSLLIKERI